MRLRVLLCAFVVWAAATAQDKGIPGDSLKRSSAGSSSGPAQTKGASQPTPTAKGSPATASSQAHFYRMRVIRIMDEQGFGQPVEVMRFLIPVDWRTEGGIRWTNETRCPLNIIQLAFRASSADGLSAFEYLPSYTWQSANDPQTMQIIQQQAQAGTACDGGPVVGVLDYLRQRVVARSRPGARVIGGEALQAMSQAKQNTLMQGYSQMIQAGYIRGVKAESGAIRISYAQNGQPVEEWISTTLNTIVTPTANTAALMQGQVSYTASNYVMFAEGPTALRGPVGHVDPKLMATILASIRPNPQYQAAVNQFLANMSQIAQKGATDRARIWQQAGQQISNIITQTYQQNQAIQDRAAEQFSQAVRGVETYIQPDGQRVELTGGYDNAWMNNRGEYLLSDQPGFNPAVQLQENWQPLRKTR